MSAATESESGIICCASCGIAGGEDIKLRKCTACYLVSYCGVTCQKAHRKQHKGECKKRAAELRDELLFKQPEGRCDGDCPICMLPLPIDNRDSTMMECCSKFICDGCSHANEIRENEMRLQHACPFCRKPCPETEEEAVKQRMKRIETNDPNAICQQGGSHFRRGDYSDAFKWYTKAVKLGNVRAHCNLAHMYHEGLGVEKHEGKETYHLEEAAIGGHVVARHNLGCEEWNVGNAKRAVKHWMIGAALGFDLSIKDLMDAFREGVVSKEDLDVALRAHKAAVDETKSPQRNEAEELFRRKGNPNWT